MKHNYEFWRKVLHKVFGFFVTSKHGFAKRFALRKDFRMIGTTLRPILEQETKRASTKTSAARAPLLLVQKRTHGSGSAAKTVPDKVEGALCSVVRYSRVTEPKPAPLEFRQQLLLALVQCTGNSPISDKMSVGGN